MFGRYEKLLDMITSLSLQVSNLQARLTSLEFRLAVGEKPEPEEEKDDPETERRNRLFSEGLENLMAYDGRPQEESTDGNE